MSFFTMKFELETHKQKAYKEWNNLSFPITEEIHKTIISIPISPVMTNEEVENAFFIGMLTYRVTKNDGLTTIELYGGYLGEEAMTLPKGTVLAEIHQLYTEYIPEPTIEEDTPSHIIYSDDNISIHSLNGTVDSCELIIEPEGESYIKVHLPA